MTDAQLRAIGASVLVIEFVVSMGLTAFVLLAGGLGQWWRDARARQLDAARDVMARLLSAPTMAVDDLAVMAALPWSVRRALVLEFGRAVQGVSIRRLSTLGQTMGLVEHAERMCGSVWWWRRLSGARVLGALDHDCPALRARLDDPNPTVRAEVLHWAAGRADGRVIEALVARLIDPARLCRFTVRDSLLRVGHPAAVALEEFLRQGDPAALSDALLVARGLAQPNLLEPAVALSQHADATVRARALGVLGVLGGDRAAATMLARLEDHDAGVREAAARAIGEIGHWDGASALAQRLGDPSFPVRRESALSLRRLGGVGMLLLRRARGSTNPFVADMATQVLDLPDSVFHRIAA
jgi:hypothetical protein